MLGCISVIRSISGVFYSLVIHLHIHWHTRCVLLPGHTRAHTLTYSLQQHCLSFFDDYTNNNNNKHSNNSNSKQTNKQASNNDNWLKGWVKQGSYRQNVRSAFAQTPPLSAARPYPQRCRSAAPYAPIGSQSSSRAVGRLPRRRVAIASLLPPRRLLRAASRAVLLPRLGSPAASRGAPREAQLLEAHRGI